MTIQATFPKDAPRKTGETVLIDDTEMTEEKMKSAEAVRTAVIS